MIRTQISFDEKLYREAKRCARQQRISVAELCRRGVREELRRQSQHRDKPWMKFSGSFDSGDPRSSQTIDEFLASLPNR